MPGSASFEMPDDDPRIGAILDKSSDTGMCICFGYVGRGPTIRQAVAENGRLIGHYDKTHLGDREETVIEALENLIAEYVPLDASGTRAEVVGIMDLDDSYSRRSKDAPRNPLGMFTSKKTKGGSSRSSSAGSKKPVTKRRC